MNTNMNLSQHSCTGKYPELKKEQYSTCLVSFESKAEFLTGDVVVLTKPLTLIDRVFDTDDLLLVECVTDLGGVGITLDGVNFICADPEEIRTATVAELNAKRRLSNAEHSLAEVP